MHRMKLLVVVAGTIAGMVGCASVKPVKQGSVYRSGQLSAAQLEDTIKRNDIRTVVNLRGYQPTSSWYKAQTDIVDRLGVEQVDLEIGNAGPTEKQTAELLDVFQRAPKPILVHSYYSRGATGLAAGMYRMGIDGEKGNKKLEGEKGETGSKTKDKDDDEKGKGKKKDKDD